MSELKVFIGWSKEPSGKIAEQLEWLLSRCLSGIRTFRSESMEKGIAWFQEIMDKLDEASVGLFCITPENKDSVWLHWEAATLFAKVKSDNMRVCPVLFGLKKSDLGEPLSALSATSRDSKDIRQLLENINARSSSPVTKEVLDDQWDAWWLKFDEQVEKILKASPQTAKPTSEPSREAGMIEELLLMVRRNERGVSLSHRSTIELAAQMGSYLVARGLVGPAPAGPSVPWDVSSGSVHGPAFSASIPIQDPTQMVAKDVTLEQMKAWIAELEKREEAKKNMPK